MKDRGKAVETYKYNGNYLTTDYYSSSDHLPCKKHPSSSSVGICAYCLKDRLVKLVCSDCGEQRLSSCSCSETSSSDTNNPCTIEFGSVGRISFLIENERTEKPLSNSKLKLQEKADPVVLLKRSSSSHVETKRSNGFWRIGRLFGKKREKDCERASVGGFDEKSDLWVSGNMGVSRSKSVCSFRGGGSMWTEDGGDCTSVSAARSSRVNGGLLQDTGEKSWFSEAESRKIGFADEKKVDVLESENGLKCPIKMVYKFKESDFNAMDDDSGFIDLKLDLSSESKTEFSVSDLDSAFTPSLRDVSSVGGDHERGGSFRSLVGDGIFSNGGSCRFTVDERGIKKSRNSFKVWRWIFKHHHHSNCGTTKKKDEDHVLKW